MIELDNLDALSVKVCDIPLIDDMATNLSYAHAYHLKKYAGIDIYTPLNCTMEHSVCGYGGFHHQEIIHDVPFVLTYSSYRSNHMFKDYGKRAMPIGPFIHYVDEYYDKERVEKQKKERGKTLLVFPAHSLAQVKTNYDGGAFIERIKRIASNYMRVLVCLSINDLQPDLVNSFIGEGWEVVTAGYALSRGFLPRLKSIIELSDAVVANIYTTGLVYSIYMGKPVYLYNQKIEIEVVKRRVYEPKVHMELYDEFIKVTDDPLFSSYNKQWEWGLKYAGFNEIKTRSELRVILEQAVRK